MKSLMLMLPSTRSPRQFELPGRGKGARDRGPGQRQVDIVERIGQLMAGILVIEHAVLDPDFGERHLVVGAGLHGARDGPG